MAKHEMHISRMSGAFAAERRRGLPTLTVDGGNFLRPWSTPDEPTFSRADIMCDLMELIGYDALTPGENELSLGRSALLELCSRHPSLRMVSANVRDKKGQFVFPPYLIIKKDNVVFGVTGITDPMFYAYQIKKHGVREDFRIDDPSRALSKLVSEIANRCDVVVALLQVAMNDADTLLTTVSGVTVAIQGHNPPAWASDRGNLVTLGGYQARALPKRSIGKATVLYPPSSQGAYSWAKVHLDSRGVALSAESDLQSLAGTDPEDPRVVQLVEGWYKLAQFDSHYSNTLKNLLREGPQWLRNGCPWYLAKVDGEAGGETIASMEGAHDLDIGLIWRGPLDWDRGPLYADLLRPRQPFRLIVSEAEDRREVNIGDTEERVFADLLSFLAAQERSIAERDSLLVRLQAAKNVTRFRPMYSSSVPGRISEYLKTQAAALKPGNPPYWLRRGVVYEGLTIGPEGEVLQATSLENNGWLSSSDSMKAMLTERTWETERIQGSESRNIRFVVGAVTDRREERFEAGIRAVQERWADHRGRPKDELLPEDAGTWKGDRLPGDVGRCLMSKKMAHWLTVWQQADPSFSLDDFITTASDTVWSAVGLERARRNGRPSPFLRRSPGGKWYLDMFSGTLERDPESTVLDGGWVDRDTFVLIGWSAVEHPRFENGTWGYLPVPTVWVGEVETRLARRFQGALSPEINTLAVRQKLNAMRREAFPGLN